MIPSRELIEKIQEKRKQYFKNMDVGQYDSVSKICNLGSLLNVGMGALQHMEDNSKGLSYCSPIDVLNVLDEAKKLIPYEEMEFVDTVVDLLEEHVS